MTGHQPRPRRQRLAQYEAVKAFTILVRAGWVIPVSPAPGVYAWAPARHYRGSAS